MVGATGLVAVVVFLLHCQVTAGEWRVDVEFLNYTAPDRSKGNNSCDGHAARQQGQGECDPVFRLCQGELHHLACNESHVFPDTHSIQFGQEGGALFPPHVLTTLPAEYVVDVQVRDHDAPHEGVEVHAHLGRHTFSRSHLHPGSQIPFEFSAHHSRLWLRLVVQCNPPYVGPRCDCKPEGSLLCNVTTGHQYCAPGHSGPGCQNTTSRCQPDTCQNGATCHEGRHHHTCHCAPGYYGQHCHLSVDDCSGVTCHHGGTCVDGVSGFTCQCAEGYFGVHCERSLDTLDVACQHGGHLHNGRCLCPHQWTGDFCETHRDPCHSHPCHNGGSCSRDTHSFHCSCPYGFSGKLCQDDHSHPCHPNPCLHGASCHYVIGATYCQCSAGYKGDKCEVRVGDCSSNPCLHGATCRDSASGFVCTCPPGFSGTHCQHDDRQQALVG